jgi:hypothetical protein
MEVLYFSDFRFSILVLLVLLIWVHSLLATIHPSGWLVKATVNVRDNNK